MSIWRTLKGFRTLDTGGRRIIGLTKESGKPIFAPTGHSLLLSANGGGKTTGGAMPWLFSLLSSPSRRAILVLDSKDGEMAIQAAPMLAKMGLSVGVIDDLEVWPELGPFRISLNPFAAAVTTFLRDPRDMVFVAETIMHALIPEPPGGPDKNFHFREVPREFDSFALNALLARDPATATPGGVASFLSDSDMFRTLADTDTREGGPALRTLARNVLDMERSENFGQHLSEARRSLRLFAPGTRLYEAGKDATLTHADVIRDFDVVFLVGPQAHMNRLGAYYALHILAFCDALYQRVGGLTVIADEFTNTPLKSLVESLTTLRAYGGEIHLIAQSRSEIIRKFGEQECQTIEENAMVKQWFGFSSFEEAERVSKAIGEEHAVASGISGDDERTVTNTNLSLVKQRHMSPAELMAMPRDRQLIHIKGVGFVLAGTLGQNQIAPYCHLIGENMLEGGRLPPDPKITLKTPEPRT